MGDDHHGEFRRGFRSKNGDGRVADLGIGDTQSFAGAAQLKKSGCDGDDGDDRNNESWQHYSSPAICFLRMLRTVHQIAKAATGTNAAVTILGSTPNRPLSWAAFTRYPKSPTT